MRLVLVVLSILRLDVVMNPPVFNNCAGSLHLFGRVSGLGLMHVTLFFTVTLDFATFAYEFLHPVVLRD